MCTIAGAIARQTHEDLEVLWNPLAASSSGNRYHKILESLDLNNVADQIYSVELLCWIARAESHQGKLSDAATALEESHMLLKELGDAVYSSTKIRWLLERARLYVLEKTPSQAEYLLTDAWEMAQAEHKDHLLVEILYLHSTYELPKYRSKWIKKAIDIGERSACERARKWLDILYVDLSWKYYDQKRHQAGIDQLKKALEILETHSAPAEKVLSVKWAIGKQLRALGKTEAALIQQENLLSTFRSENVPIGRLYEELAECFHSLKKTEEAERYFRMAYHELTKPNWIRDSHHLNLKRLKDLGRVDKK